jgi:NADH dehydrogenase
LYQVAAAALSPAQIAYPIRAILRRQKNATVLLGEVAGVDPGRHEVQLGGSKGARIAFDSLVIATGAQHSYFGHDEWQHYALGLKTLEDATELRRRILLAFEQAEVESDAAERRHLLSFAIIGAGPTGVELAGAIVQPRRRRHRGRVAARAHDCMGGRCGGFSRSAVARHASRSRGTRDGRTGFLGAGP